MSKNTESENDNGKYANRWPEVDDELLRALWLEHNPAFLKLDEPWEESLKKVRIPFLTYLESIGVPLERPERQVDIKEVVMAARSGHRMKLETVDYRRSGNSAQAMVAISLRGKTAEGWSTREVVGNHVIWLPAEAVMKAAHALIPVIDFEIVSAFSASTSLGSRDDIAVVVARDPEKVIGNRLVGACEITTSEPEAGAKAALSAINRHAEIAATFYPET